MSDLPLISAPLLFPCTSGVIIVCCGICTFLNSRGLGYAEVGSSYRLVVIEGQWWRTVTASFSHLSVLHLMFNAYSTWQLKEAEKLLGPLGYLSTTFIFLLLSIVVQNALHAIFARTRWGDQTQNTVGIGFSCVVFAWMTWAALHPAGSNLDLVFVKVPFSISPFASLFFTQLVIANVDFVGHLAGIIAGYIHGWGLLSWLDEYWLLQVLVWALVAVVVSLPRGGHSQVIQALALSLEEAEAKDLAMLRDAWDLPSTGHSLPGPSTPAQRSGFTVSNP